MSMPLFMLTINRNNRMNVPRGKIQMGNGLAGGAVTFRLFSLQRCLVVSSYLLLRVSNAKPCSRDGMEIKIVGNGLFVD